MRSNLRCQKGAACSKVTLLGEGSNAGYTNNELWRAGNSFLRMRSNSDAQKGAACSKVTSSEGSNAGSTNNELWGAENSFLRMRGQFFLGLIFMIHNLQKLVHMQSRALAAESDDVRKIASPQSSSSHLVLGRHARNVPNRGKQTACPSFLEKRDRTRAELLHKKKLTVHADFPLKDIACVLLAPNKRRQDCVCHRGFK